MFAMENMTKKQTCVHKTTTSSPLTMHTNSHLITKAKPKIRIIHIFAPEIIKTDVANFRELVQRLTGKPNADENNNNKKKSKPRKEDYARSKRVELGSSRFSEFKERIKGEEEIWCGGINQNTGGFLGGFADVDGFMQELNEFQMLPIDGGSGGTTLGPGGVRDPPGILRRKYYNTPMAL